MESSITKMINSGGIIYRMINIFAILAIIYFILKAFSNETFSNTEFDSNYPTPYVLHQDELDQLALDEPDEVDSECLASRPKQRINHKNRENRSLGVDTDRDLDLETCLEEKPPTVRDIYNDSVKNYKKTIPKMERSKEKETEQVNGAFDISGLSHNQWTYVGDKEINTGKVTDNLGSFDPSFDNYSTF